VLVEKDVPETQKRTCVRARMHDRILLVDVVSREVNPKPHVAARARVAADKHGMRTNVNSSGSRTLYAYHVRKSPVVGATIRLGSRKKGSFIGQVRKEVGRKGHESVVNGSREA